MPFGWTLGATESRQPGLPPPAPPLKAVGTHDRAQASLCLERVRYEADSAGLVAPMFPERVDEERWRDHEGIYRVVFHEPEEE